MRPAVLAGFALAVLPAVAPAQPTTYRATVADAEVTLRAGPSDKYPETETLRRGTTVVVHEEAPGGWLAVQTPAAVSWVPTQYIDFDKAKTVPQYVTTQDEVTLAPGRVGLPQPLAEIRLAKLPAGTLLKVIGTPEKFDNKTWYPVEPPFGDYRYLPKTAVQAAGAVNTSFVVRDSAPPGLPPAGVATPPGPATPTAQESSAPKPVVDHPLWAQADAAEKDGRLDDADKLLFRLAAVMNEPGGDHDVANLCYSRIHILREKKRAGGALGAFPSTPAGSSGSRTPATPTSTGTPPAPPRDDRPTLLPPLRTGDAPGVRPPATARVEGDAPGLPEPADDRPRWVGAGTLTRSALALDGRPTYALESSPGVVRMYVVGASGVDLERYKNRRIDVYGTTHTRKDLKKAYLVATDVNPNP